MHIRQCSFVQCTAQQMHSCHDEPGGCPSEISKGCPGQAPRELGCGGFDMQIMPLVFTFEMIQPVQKFETKTIFCKTLPLTCTNVQYTQLAFAMS